MPKKLKWDEIPAEDLKDEIGDVGNWNPIEAGRCGTDSILSLGYGLRHRAEIEEWADNYGFSVDWR